MEVYSGLMKLDPLKLTPKQKLFRKNHHQRWIFMNDIIIRAQPSANVEVHDPTKLRENFAKLDLKYSQPDINSELKWDNPNNMERGINPILQIDRKMVAKKTPVTDADGHIMGYNIQYRKTPGSKQTQLAFGPNPGKVMKALKMLKKGKGQGTSEEPIFFT
jgi:hypothetical protein